MRALVHVPKEEIDKAMEAEKQRKRKKVAPPARGR